MITPQQLLTTAFIPDNRIYPSSCGNLQVHRGAIIRRLREDYFPRLVRDQIYTAGAADKLVSSADFIRQRLTDALAQDYANMLGYIWDIYGPKNWLPMGEQPPNIRYREPISDEYNRAYLNARKMWANTNRSRFTP